MRYPEFLRDKGTIGFVAPSCGCGVEPYYTAFNHALDKWTAMGYGKDLGPNCYASHGIGISSDPKSCGEELNDWYCSDKNDAIVSCGGGELMCEIVPYLDFERLKKARPKWYMGYSDNTNFTFLSAILLDTAAIYGPCASSFGMEPWHPAISAAWDVITGKTDTVRGYDLWEKESLKTEKNPLAPYNVTEPVEILGYLPTKDGKMRRADMTEEIRIKGRLIGGCLDVLQMYPGTPYDKVRDFNEKYKEDGIIWFLEACDLNVMAIRRALWQLKEAGWFQYLKGFLIGRPLCMGQEMFGCDQYQAVTDLLEEYGVPVIMDMDIGHCSPMMPMISGSTAEVSVQGNEAEIHFTMQ